MNHPLVRRMYWHVGNRNVPILIFRAGKSSRGLCNKETSRPLMGALSTTLSREATLIRCRPMTSHYLLGSFCPFVIPASPSAPTLIQQYLRQSSTSTKLFKSRDRSRPLTNQVRSATGSGSTSGRFIQSGCILMKADGAGWKADCLRASSLGELPVSSWGNVICCSSTNRMFSTSTTKHFGHPLNFKSTNLSPSKVLGVISNNSQRNVGRSSHNHDDIKGGNFNFNQEKSKLRLRDRTKHNFQRRVSKLKKSFSFHNSRLKDKLDAQKIRGVLAVGKLRKKLKVKKENIKTLPNLLTTLRMASAPVLAYLVVNDHFGAAFSLFVVAGVTDLLDGYIARNFKNQRTALGTALDPLADKLLVSFLTLSLTSAGLIPLPLTVLILSRDAGLIIASFYIRYISLSPPRTLARYFDVSLVTAKLYPSNISKLNTALQLSYVASTLASPVFDFVGHPLLQLLMYTTATTTFLSGADYVLTWRRRLKIVKNK